jgi:exosortase family protein XrtG
MGTLAVIGVALWVLTLLFFKSHRNWLPYYLVGSVGLTISSIALSRTILPVEELLKRSLTTVVHQFGSYVSLDTRLIDEVPGALMVLVIPQIDGWTVFNVGVESSGLLEMSVMIGIVGFYPGWSAKRRVLAGLLGLTATFVANVARIMFIAFMLQNVGKDALFISHTVLGRMIFAILVLGIFWYVLSIGTLNVLSSRIRKGD